MEFILDNYIWFIVGGIIILMAVIGYFAEKTDFGRSKKVEAETEIPKEKSKEKPKEKPKKEKKSKKENAEEKQEKIEIDNKGINDLVQSELVTDNLTVENPEEPLTDVNVSDTNENVDQSLFAPLEDFTAKDTTEEVQEQPVVIDELINEPKDSDEKLGNDDLKPIDSTPLADVSSSNDNEEKNVSDDDDVWKF